MQTLPISTVKDRLIELEFKQKRSLVGVS